MLSEPTLTYQVYVAPIIAMAGRDVPPGQSRSTWSPISATLICGRYDAVLVDPLMTVEQGMAVADWVSTTGKDLTTVYVTHGHGDHWFGLGAVRERFPGVRAVATPAVVEAMRKSSAPQVLQTFWQSRFPARSLMTTLLPIPWTGRPSSWKAISWSPLRRAHRHRRHHGPARTGHRAGRRRRRGIQRRAPVPGGIRLPGPPGLARGSRHHRGADPRAVVAGHKRYGNDDNPRIIDETRQYISDFDRLDKETTTAEELYWQMLAITRTESTPARYGSRPSRRRPERAKDKGAQPSLRSRTRLLVARPGRRRARVFDDRRS